MRVITIITRPHTNGAEELVIEVAEATSFMEIDVDGVPAIAIDLTTEYDADDGGDQDKLVVFEAVTDDGDRWERIAEVPV